MDDGQLNPNNEIQTEESVALRSILRKKTTRDFFQDVWQKRAVIFQSCRGGHSAVDFSADGSWNDEKMQDSPLEEMIHQGWHILPRLLHQAEIGKASQQDDENPPEHMVPLLFQNRELKNPDEISKLYGTSLFAAYLDGCSVVLNHGDLLSPWIAALCQDLQKSFPHAYANCYLTPPNSQAVKAHADDRDVLVIQLIGSKNWQVYEKVPVPYPYPHEQVGKEGIPVPQQVLDGPVAVSTTLQPGDVLYMPRGFVHQARCSTSLSFHLTVALATHDWSLAGTVSAATQAALTRVVDFRKSIFPTAADPKELQLQVDMAMKMIQEQVTAESILDKLNSRLENHNRRAFSSRMQLIHSARFPSTTERGQQEDIVGQKAAKQVTLASTVRAATQAERALVPRNESQPQGLNVRAEIADSITAIISNLKSDPNIRCKVVDLRSLMPVPNALVCDLALLSLAKRAVELGALAVVLNS